MFLLPEVFIERLKNIIPPDYFLPVLNSFSQHIPITVRINTLKTTAQEIILELSKRNINHKVVPWSMDALILPQITQEELEKTELIAQGCLYNQSLSSMLPAIILNPHKDENILDMCAAPGSKTTQIAALMNNEGKLVAIDSVKNRYYKLRSVIEKLGVANVECKLMDARRYRAIMLFDKILADVPCSCETRFKTFDKDSLKYWSPRKIKEMAHKQKGLLLSATRLLRPGGTLIYSTCTFSPEENEAVIDWVLRKTQGTIEVVPIENKGWPTYPAKLEWQEKIFHSGVKNCLRLLPTADMEGFFIAKLQRIN